MKAESVIKHFNKVNGILADLTEKDMTYDSFSYLLDFCEQYRNFDFVCWIEDELKNSETDLEVLYKIVSVISQSSPNKAYKSRMDKLKCELKQKFESAEEDFEYENRRYQEFNKKYDSIIRNVYDPETVEFIECRTKFEKAREKMRKAESELERYDTVISDIFELCSKMKKLLIPFCREDFSKPCGITINSTHYNISSENQQITNIHTEHNYNQRIDNRVINLDIDNRVTNLDIDNRVTNLGIDNRVANLDIDNSVTNNNIDNSVTNNNIDNSVTNNNIDNSVTNNSNVNTSGRNNASNSPVDVSSQNIQYFNSDFAKRIYPLFSNFHDLKEKETYLEPNNILSVPDINEFYFMLNIRFLGDYKQYVNAKRDVILAFIFVLKDYIREKKYREEWEQRMYSKFFDSKEPNKIHEDVRKHKNEEYANSLKEALKKV